MRQQADTRTMNSTSRSAAAVRTARRASVATYYHRPRPENAENLHLLRRLDEMYLGCPFFGSRRMAVTLEVNRKRIQRLMRILGIEAF